jgi:hypothetical protein
VTGTAIVIRALRFCPLGPHWRRALPWHDVLFLLVEVVQCRLDMVQHGACSLHTVQHGVLHLGAQPKVGGGRL